MSLCLIIQSKGVSYYTIRDIRKGIQVSAALINFSPNIEEFVYKKKEGNKFSHFKGIATIRDLFNEK